jgi:hypothetical protein
LCIDNDTLTVTFGIRRPAKRSRRTCTLTVPAGRAEPEHEFLVRTEIILTAV